MIYKYFLPFHRLPFCIYKFELKNSWWGTSLVVQWLRIHLPVQGTRVWSLVQEDPTCCEATKPVRHNYWACALEPAHHRYWAHVPQLLKPACLEPMLHNKRSHRNEAQAPQRRVAPARRNQRKPVSEDPTQTKKKKQNKTTNWCSNKSE